MIKVRKQSKTESILVYSAVIDNLFKRLPRAPYETTKEYSFRVYFPVSLAPFGVISAAKLLSVKKLDVISYLKKPKCFRVEYPKCHHIHQINFRILVVQLVIIFGEIILLTQINLEIEVINLIVSLKQSIKQKFSILEIPLK